ncbi:hypothetical protein DXT99_22250 [Pontibacter diazotrophicus]|uniref:GH15-like domain-containing protein n=1 Tax=Pontibacter diazotrophicus TaxID=1400979 RepID=A0A3D8L5T8_9BACT|nr:glycoside hydrolase family 15 protein [Pontibacter diazotrophicus]RDV12643.1 hypothetical protein DXT99_22250 [Pontibacter diazotrophicus]
MRSGSTWRTAVCFRGDKGSLLLEDWMPINARLYGICRQLSESPEPYAMQLNPRPNYARQPPVIERKEEKHATFEFDFHLHASHPLTVEPDSVSCQVPAGEKALFIVAEKALDTPADILEEVRSQTLQNWREIANHITCKGPYEEEVRKSLRLLRMLTYSQNGGIIAAATTSLPEVIRGKRNYHYRYMWLRDAAMIVSALARAGTLLSGCLLREPLQPAISSFLPAQRCASSYFLSRCQLPSASVLSPFRQNCIFSGITGVKMLEANYLCQPWG